MTHCLLATAVAREWHVHHLDIRTADLYAPMEMEVYITIPEGFENAGEDALLVYAMYGTTQAGNLLRRHFAGSLAEEGAARSPAKLCLFDDKTGDDVVDVEAHVDTGADVDAVPAGQEGRRASTRLETWRRCPISFAWRSKGTDPPKRCRYPTRGISVTFSRSTTLLIAARQDAVGAGGGARGG